MGGSRYREGMLVLLIIHDDRPNARSAVRTASVAVVLACWSSPKKDRGNGKGRSLLLWLMMVLWGLGNFGKGRAEPLGRRLGRCLVTSW